MLDLRPLIESSKDPRVTPIATKLISNYYNLKIKDYIKLEKILSTSTTAHTPPPPPPISTPINPHLISRLQSALKLATAKDARAILADFSLSFDLLPTDTIPLLHLIYPNNIPAPIKKEFNIV